MRRFGRRGTQAAVVLGVAALAVAVATGFTSGRTSTGLAKGTIKVGYGNNLTGFLAVHDKLISNGAKLAVEQINGKGGIGGKVKIALTLEDVKSDPAVSVQVANDLIGKHVGVLVVEHDLRLIMRICDHVVVLNEGEVIASGSPGDVRTDPAVVAAYIGTDDSGNATNGGAE